jgi:Tfp pilus assembly protein PilF
MPARPRGGTVAETAERGLMLLRQGHWREAQAAFEAVVRAEPRSFAALCNLAQVALALGEAKAGLGYIDRALRERADVAEAHHLRACLLQQLGLVPEAIDAYRRALALRPDAADALSNLGGLLLEQKRLDEALAVYDRALAVRADFAEARNNRGAVLLALDRPGAALEEFRRAAALRPGFADAYANAGSALLSLGDIEAARAAFRQAIRAAPREGRYYRDLAGCHRFTEDDPDLTAMRALAGAPAGLGTESRIELAFALGKATADVGQWAESFRHYRQGNALKRVTVAYDEAETLRAMERAGARFTAERLDRALPGPAAEQPIFVVGMPRSGTTLVEQILASHGLVFGAGERPDLHEAILRGVGDVPAAMLFDAAAALPEAALRRIGEDYATRMRGIAGDAARVVDKMPGNFLHLGVIRLALPHARVIHVRRDPLDTCVSCFCTLFSGEQPFSYNLAELGRYYRAYEALMRHWRRVLPRAMLLEIAYEDVVEDLEGAARRMLAHCALPWDARCLRFQDTSRTVRTASRAQVRQPLYRGSVGRSAVYAPWLGPLRDALGGASGR